MTNKYKYIDLTYLREVSVDGNFMIKIFAIFKSEVPKIEERMNKALAEKNWEKLGKIAHKSKSSISVLGMHKEIENMLQLEIDAKNKNKTETFARRIELFIQNCKNAIREIEQVEKKLTAK